MAFTIAFTTLTNVFLLLAKPLKDSPGYMPRLIGMTITSALLGFVIGGVLGLIVMSMFRRFQSEGFPAKFTIIAGGLIGAVASSVIFLYLVM